MLGHDFITILSGIFFLISFVTDEYERHIPKKIIVFQVIVTSVIQCMYVGIYISSLYLDSNLSIYLALILLIVMCITAFTMYKWQIKLSYWLSLNLIISPVLSFALIQLDTSIFDRPFGGITEGLTPIASVITSIILQVSLWLFVKFQKWLSRAPKTEKVSLQQDLITYLKITGFQVILSLLLESVFIFYNVVLSSIAIILALILIFIVRNKLRGSYNFWILSWSAISFIGFVLGARCFWDFWGYNNQVTSDGKIHMYTIIGLTIYHLLLTVYFRFRAEDQMPEELS